jgi:hypothetical protein
MGMRRNIAVTFDDAKRSTIYFYTHWGAEHLEETLRAALQRGMSRWDDPSYLARIIFSEMIQDEVMETTGYGIAPYEIEAEFATISVDLTDRTVDGVPFETFVAAEITR